MRTGGFEQQVALLTCQAVIESKGSFKKSLRDHADGKRRGKLYQGITDLEPGLVSDVCTTPEPGSEICLYPHLINGTLAVPAHDAERIRIDPLEGLLLPFHPDDRKAHPQMLYALHVIERLNLGLACIPVEAIRIRRKGPDRFGRGFQIPLPGEMKLFSHDA